MKRMLIAAHARFADGLESALSLIMGKREDITCINAFVTETPLEKQIDDYAESLGEGDQVLVITDAFFGSVNQKIMGKRLKNSLILLPKHSSLPWDDFFIFAASGTNDFAYSGYYAMLYFYNGLC